jgi:hypothetical protein
MEQLTEVLGQISLSLQLIAIGVLMNAIVTWVKYLRETF